MARTLKQISDEIGKVSKEQTLKDFRELKKENPNWMNSEEAIEMRNRRWSGDYEYKSTK